MTRYETLASHLHGDELEDGDFESLLAFRDGLRQFLNWSEQQAKGAGITAAQHQLLLAVRGHRGAASVSDIAGHLLLRHHSVVELLDRATAADLVERVDDLHDQRVVRVRLTPNGEAVLRRLTAAHFEELSRIGDQLTSLWSRLPSMSPSRDGDREPNESRN
ncbi:MAG: MarR family winged helix-turn-helix transcriptional regulator [Microthrixaceae bacterium]